MTLLGSNVFAGNDPAKVTAQIARRDFLFVKASEGQTTRDSRHDAIVGQVRAAKKTVGHFHFAWPNQDPAREAANFFAAAKPQPGDLLALDLEDWGDPTVRPATGWAARFAYWAAFRESLSALVDAPLIVYVNWDWLRNLRTVAPLADWERLIRVCPLWIADWTGTPGSATYAAPKPGGTVEWHPTFHQYQSGGTTGLDEDWFVGGLTDLPSYGVRDDMTQQQYDALMAAVNGVMKQAQTNGSAVSVVAGQLAALSVKVDGLVASGASKQDVELLKGQIARAELDLSTAISGVGNGVAESVAATLDRELGGVEVSARYVRRTGGSP